MPAALIAGVVGGDGFAPIVMGALVGAPAYVNGYAAPPLVAGLMEQGMSPGAAMAFMVAGVREQHPGHGRRVVARASAGVRRLCGLRHRGRHLERRAVRYACRLNRASRLAHHPRTERIRGPKHRFPDTSSETAPHILIQAPVEPSTPTTSPQPLPRLRRRDT